MRGTSRGLAAMAAMAMAGHAFASEALVIRAPKQVAKQSFDVTPYDPWRDVGDAPNKRTPGAGMASVRAARKRRNQARNRSAHRRAA